MQRRGGLVDSGVITRRGRGSAALRRACASKHIGKLACARASNGLALSSKLPVLLLVTYFFDFLSLVATGARGSTRRRTARLCTGVALVAGVAGDFP